MGIRFNDKVHPLDINTATNIIHDCGVCDGRLKFAHVDPLGRIWWRCKTCQGMHCSEDCCSEFFVSITIGHKDFARYTKLGHRKRAELLDKTWEEYWEPWGGIPSKFYETLTDNTGEENMAHNVAIQAGAVESIDGWHPILRVGVKIAWQGPAITEVTEADREEGYASADEVAEAAASKYLGEKLGQILA